MRPLSLGVGTFNLRQQLAIQDQLEERRRDEPDIELFFDRSRDEPFFVKNLENIQGDERDVIFLSVTYAKGRDGRLRQNFGPLNGENGWRRLNVLTTRARRAMRVFSSMRASDIHEGQSKGGPLLKAFLEYAEPGRLDHPGGRRGSRHRVAVRTRGGQRPDAARARRAATGRRRGLSHRHRRARR